MIKIQRPWKYSMAFFLIFLFFGLGLSVQAKEFYNYHCGYLENEDGSFSKLWSTTLMGPYRYPKFGEYQDYGSLIYNGKTAICMMSEGNDLSGDTLNLFISFYEGESVNYAPGQCSFLGAETYLPYGEQITNTGQLTAYHISATTGRTFLVFQRVLNDQDEFLNDDCANDLKNFL